MERLNLLLADDDSDDCSFFEEAVAEIAPHSTIQIKKDGEEVLKYLFNPHSILPDVIFLDMNMPFIDGVKCLEEIRYNSKMNNIFKMRFVVREKPFPTGVDTLAGAFCGVKPASLSTIVIPLHSIPNDDVSVVG